MMELLIFVFGVGTFFLLVFLVWVVCLYYIYEKMKWFFRFLHFFLGKRTA